MGVVRPHLMEGPMPGAGDVTAPRVALLVTCLVDAMRPRIGFAALRLLEEAGCTVEVPEAQTCCGQPAYNSGDDKDAADLARRVVAAFEPYDYVVLPSGSCAGTIRAHYPDLLAGDPAWAGRSAALAAKTWEITSFLVDVLGFQPEGRELRQEDDRGNRQGDGVIPHLVSAAPCGHGLHCRPPLPATSVGALTSHRLMAQ